MDIKSDDLNLYIKVNQTLTEGLIVKNYKELCKILSVNVGTGKQKKLQLENLKRFFDYEKRGQKFVIKEIFDTPLEKIDKRINPDNELLTTYIESILLLDFTERDTYTISYTKNELWKKLGMINSFYNNRFNREKTVTFDMLRYDYCKSNGAVGFANYNINPWMLNNFYCRTRTIINNKIKIALNRLQKRKLLTWSEVLWKCEPGNKHYVVDNDKEQAVIMSCERKTINELVGSTKKVNGKTVPTTIQDVINNRNKNINYDTYRRSLNKELLCELGILYVYRRYQIIVNKDCLKQGLEDNYKILTEQINGKIIDIVDTDADRMQEKYMNCRYYADFQKYLSQKLLRLDTVLQADFFNRTLEDSPIKDYELDNLFG